MTAPFSFLFIDAQPAAATSAAAVMATIGRRSGRAPKHSIVMGPPFLVVDAAVVVAVADRADALPAVDVVERRVEPGEVAAVLAQPAVGQGDQLADGRGVGERDPGVGIDPD